MEGNGNHYVSKGRGKICDRIIKRKKRTSVLWWWDKPALLKQFSNRKIKISNKLGNELSKEARYMDFRHTCVWVDVVSDDVSVLGSPSYISHSHCYLFYPAYFMPWNRNQKPKHRTGKIIW